MKNIHEHYDKLNAKTKDAVDDAFCAMVDSLEAQGMKGFNFGDGAEHVIDAISLWVIESGHGQ